MKKKILLLCIIVFPSLIYFVFELTQANFKKMAYFGPKTVNEKGDTVYWSVPDIYFIHNLTASLDTFKSDKGLIVTKKWRVDSTLIDTVAYPVHLILFVDEKLRSEGYKLEGIYDYIKYKKADLKDVPVFIVSSLASADSKVKLNENHRGEFDSLKINLPNFHPLVISYKDRKDFLAKTYFKQKPHYVFDYFMVLVDKKRHIRGYYDPSFNAEVKRMIQEYKHLKIRDEYGQTLKQNDIKQQNAN